MAARDSEFSKKKPEGDYTISAELPSLGVLLPVIEYQSPITLRIEENAAERGNFNITRPIHVISTVSKHADKR